MAEPAVDLRFAAALRRLRAERGLSLRQLGRRINYGRTVIHDLETGAKAPTVDKARRLDAALQSGGELEALMSADTRGHRADGPNSRDITTGLQFPPDWRQGMTAVAGLFQEDMHRRDVLRSASFSAAAYLTPAMRWLTSPLDERPCGDGDRLVGAPDVDMVRQLTAVYRTMDNQHGGGHIRDSVVRFLVGDVAPLLRGRYDPGTGSSLLSAAAEATQLAGWATYDMGHHGLAQRYLIQALRLAAAAGDRALGAEILAAMSHQAAYLRASTEAVDLARAAGRAAVDAGIAAIQAESAVLEAQGHAVGGDEAACAKALDQAEHTLDRADRTGDPYWIGYFDESYLAAKFGHCFAALGRGDLARRFASRSLDMDGRRYARGRQFNLSLLALAHAQAGDLDQAAVVGAQAVDAAADLRSARALDYLRDLADRLGRHVGIPVVRSFVERAEPVLGRV